ncbi:MAG: phosphoribosylglycinamide formyltransferase [Gammaproteobacteria bacterium]|nr:MAG: phosphoribosylglycinamide formyltransferase [Gammaproteobacteria bacterium]
MTLRHNNLTAQKKKIVVLISGGGTNLQALIDTCKNSDCNNITGKNQQINGEIIAVISNKADVYGLERAKQSGIAHHVLSHKDYHSRDEYDQALIKLIDQFDSDLIVLAGFMRILTAEFVQQYRGKLLNIHPSLLPKYQGLNTHQRAIDAKDSEHGVSVHFVTEELDGGPVILQAKVPVFDNDNAEQLASRVHQQEHRIYPLVVKWFCENRLIMQNDHAVLDNMELSASGYANDD